MIKDKNILDPIDSMKVQSRRKIKKNVRGRNEEEIEALKHQIFERDFEQMRL